MLSEFALSVLSSGDSLAGSSEDNVEIHTENTSVGVILDTKINMLINTESEVTCIKELKILIKYNSKQKRRKKN